MSATQVNTDQVKDQSITNAKISDTAAIAWTKIDTTGATLTGLPLVALQNSTPGTPQSGHLNISGNGIFGGVEVAGSTTVNTFTANSSKFVIDGSPTALAINNTYNTDPAANIVGLDITARANYTNASNPSYVGINITTSIGSSFAGTTPNAAHYGISSIFLCESTINQQTGIAVSGIGTLTGNSTLSVLYGVYARIDNNSTSGTVSAASGVYVASPNNDNSATISSLCGIDISEQKVVGSTLANTYQIRSVGAGKVLFQSTDATITPLNIQLASTPTASAIKVLASNGSTILSELKSDGSLVSPYVSTLVGGNVSSNATITPTGTIFHVTGVTEIDTINLPFTGFTGSLYLIPDGAFSTGLTGNIALASTAVVGKTLIMTFDGTSWYPSY